MTEAETGVMQLQAKEHPELLTTPKAKRSKEISPRDERESMASHMLICNF